MRRDPILLAIAAAVAVLIGFFVVRGTTDDDNNGGAGASSSRPTIVNTNEKPTTSAPLSPGQHNVEPVEIYPEKGHESENEAVCAKAGEFGAVIFAAGQPYAPAGSDVNPQNTTAVVFPAAQAFRDAVLDWQKEYGSGYDSSQLNGPLTAASNRTITWQTTGQADEQQPRTDVPGQPLVPYTDGVFSLLTTTRYVCEQLGHPADGIPDDPSGTTGGDAGADGDYTPEGDVPTASPTS